MTMMRNVSAVVASAMLATSVTPAMAQGYGGYSYGNKSFGSRHYDRHRRHHHRGVSAGDVIAGVAIIGVLAAIAGAASKSKNSDRYRGNINSEDQAADACAIRVEQRFGNDARVRNIDDVQRTRDGYDVRGTVETSDRDDQASQSFACRVRYGQVEDVRIDDGYAYQGY